MSATRISGNAVFSAALAAVAGYAALAALAWPLKAALFPLVSALPLILLAVVQIVMELRGAPQAPSQPAMDIATDTSVPAAIARKRTLVMFAWMGTFIALVALIGFPFTVPLFVFAYLLVAAQAGWLRSVALAGAAWAAFHGLFELLLRFPFETGLLQTWLGL